MECTALASGDYLLCYAHSRASLLPDKGSVGETQMSPPTFFCDSFDTPIQLALVGLLSNAPAASALLC